MRKAKAIIYYIGIPELRIHLHEVARGWVSYADAISALRGSDWESRCLTRGGASGGLGRIPTYLARGESDGLEADRPAGVGRACALDPAAPQRRSTKEVGGRGDGCATSRIAVLKLELPQESRQSICLMHDAESGTDHSRSLATNIPGQTQAWLEVAVVSLPYAIDPPSLLHHAQGRIEVAKVAVGIFHRRSVHVAQPHIDCHFLGDAPVVLNEPSGSSSTSI